ncbi:MAG: hypothetical protein P8166_01935 [Candidatus Thiodiazotropha sp.]
MKRYTGRSPRECSWLGPLIPALWFMTIGWHGAIGAGANAPLTDSGASPPGLRFKSGPVCMCGGGLSEADIRRAELERGNSQPGKDDSEKENRPLGGESQ